MGPKIKIAGVLILIIALMYYSITSKESIKIYIMFVIAVLSFLLGKYYEKINLESRASGEETREEPSPPLHDPFPTLNDED